ncbi:hypothetical protein CR158_06960 [Halomonas heilongjiangensis]|uniref:eCIS core domain-containing protein n=2 Tax=Halomonas heilongjiangensis TaxID=1387883 RepID=A0A2N7TFF5_9GAMM|nr:hypothetical protein C1H66_22235 [Halomonas heilongjiangensis]PXX91462.1 hypothetical protein CR158_06960 [Halomonas heilongjiangensis]
MGMGYADVKATGSMPTLTRRSGGAQTGRQAEAPPSVHRTLQTVGEPLSRSARAFFEPRFGHDFGKVRVHRDAAAAQSARDVNAHAYAVGQHLAFDHGKYAPDSHAGRRLLAHELTHVVQQRGGQPMIQRDDDKEKEPEAPKAKTDVSIVLTDSDQDLDEGRTYAKTVLRVTSVEDAAKKLKALGVPIGTLYVVSHSTSAGKIQFISSIGTISWVPIADLGKALKGAVTVDTVDFRGCKVGSAAGAMESFRQTVGAQSTKGSNCWTFVTRVTPLVFDGMEVTEPSQIPQGRQKAFDKALLKQINGLRSQDGKPVKDCLLGLSAGQKAGARTLPQIWQQYWANKGNLVASWASPEFNEDWQKGSICTKDMTTSSKPCAIVETKAPTGTSSQGDRQGALIIEQPGTWFTSVADETPESEEPA